MYYYFEFDNQMLLFFILWRLIGIIIYSKTKNFTHLAIFVDFVKEYLLYLYFFNNNNKYLWLFVTCKIIFEYKNHSIHVYN